MRFHTKLKRLFILILLCSLQANGQNAPEKKKLKPAEAVVRELYKLVTFNAGQTPDWQLVKSLFIDDAVIVLRTSRTGHSVFSREAFVHDFQDFILRARVDTTGFTEAIIPIKTFETGDIAQSFVVYEASIPGRNRAPQRGLDEFHLIRQDSTWRIVSIINEIPTQARPLPEGFTKLFE
ncbi:MAG: hypothetical protein H6696_03880 [Deferribacteres bacterium]|nr:hypothetical protein [candidate division KSB1 bacterium]MCB9501052.1 hypothetical protein [Deferribacteres bacterium]